jgi:NAD+ synthase
MTTSKNAAAVAEIRSLFGVVPIDQFNAKKAIEDRIQFLVKYLRSTGRKALILGISGGVDSTVTGMLSQMACRRLTQAGYPATFVAMRLPAGIQRDEDDAQLACDFIGPDVLMTVNIGKASTSINEQGVNAFRSIGLPLTAEQIDFNKGNVKARMRMIAQYQQAANFEGLVIGTDHNSEAVMGFFTVWGDGACDVTVLGGVNKRQVRAMAKEMGAPAALWNKVPTADLEELNPGKSDDEGFGFPYALLDDFLEGLDIPSEVEDKIVAQYTRTQFKRHPIVGFADFSQF